jgi:hypothetical protein
MRPRLAAREQMEMELHPWERSHLHEATVDGPALSHVATLISRYDSTRKAQITYHITIKSEERIALATALGYGTNNSTKRCLKIQSFLWSILVKEGLEPGRGGGQSIFFIYKDCVTYN